MRNLPLAAVALAIAWIAPASFAQRAAPTLESRVEAVLAAHAPGVPGLSVALVDPEGVVHASASGLARREPPAPMGVGSRLFSGSIGKTYCAVVLMQLVAEGALGLDDLLCDHLGDLAWYDRLPNAREITVRHLANHRSGIPEHVWMPEFTGALAEDPLRSWTPEEIVAFVLDAEPHFAPGAAFSYADTNYILLGMVIERVTGSRYEDELRARVLEPLGLRDTITSSQPELPGLVSGYSRLQEVFPIREEVAADGVYCMNPQFEWTGGGIVSTTSDLARLMHEACAGGIVSDEARRQMLETVPAPQLGRDTTYGVGLIARETPAGPMRGHTGIFPGYLSGAWHLPDCGWTVAVQVNADDQAAGAALELVTAELAAIARSVQPD